MEDIRKEIGCIRGCEIGHGNIKVIRQEIRHEEGKLPGQDYQVNGQTLTFYMPKELDHHVARHLSKSLDMLVEAYVVQELVLDFGQTEFMDSSGIGVIIGRAKTMQFRGGRIYAAHMGKRVKLIFDSAGLGRMVEIKEDSRYV